MSFLSDIPTVRLIVVCVHTLFPDSATFVLLALIISFVFPNKQVVGGIDDQIPSLPSTTGVQVVTYSKLLSQVIN